MPTGGRAQIVRVRDPIGVFDSGVGGLTVFRESAAPPRHALIYLGDSARVRTATKSPEIFTRYAMQAAHILCSATLKMAVVRAIRHVGSAPDPAEGLDIPVVGVRARSTSRRCGNGGTRRRHRHREGREIAGVHEGDPCDRSEDRSDRSRRAAVRRPPEEGGEHARRAREVAGFTSPLLAPASTPSSSAAPTTLSFVRRSSMWSATL